MSVQFVYGAPPELEPEFASEVSAFRRSNAADPVWIVATSSALRTRLKLVLADRGSFLNLRFFTLEALAQEIFLAARPGAVPVADSEFFVQATARVLNRTPDLGGSARLLAPLYYATVRDLRDAGVETALLRELGRERWLRDPHDAETAEFLAGVMDLYARELESLGVADDVDVLKGAATGLGDIEAAALFVYGFLDANQVEIDFLESLVRRFRDLGRNASVFVPVRSHPAFSFSAEFLQALRPIEGRDERRVLEAAPGAAGDLEKNLLTDRVLEACPHGVEILAASGADDEVGAAVKTVLDLVQSGELADPASVLVAARGIEDYLPRIDRMFRQNGIPYWTPQGAPEAAQVRAARNLLEIFRSDFPFPNVLDMLPAAEEALRRTGVAGGLKRFDAALGALSRSPDDAASRVRGELLRVAALQPRADSWEEWGRGFGRALEELALDELARLFRRRFSTFARLGVAQPDDLYRVTELTLAQAARRPVQDAGGVAVLELQDARGVPCDVLFLLGLNNDRFPRRILEDPLLPDRLRLEIASILGNKIRRCKLPEKDAGHAEELELFALMLFQARRRAYLVYQASDESGRTLQRSAFLDVIESQFRRSKIPFPEKPFERRAAWSEPVSLLEAALGGARPGDAPEAPDPVRLTRGTREQGLRILGRFTRDRPLSPTSLASLVRCPFQFTAKYVFGVGELEEPEEDAPTARERGNFVDLLTDQVLKRWSPGQPLSEAALDEAIEAALELSRECAAGRPISPEDAARIRLAMLDLWNSQEVRKLTRGYVNFSAQKELGPTRVRFGAHEVWVKGRCDVFGEAKDSKGSLIVDTKWIAPSRLQAQGIGLVRDQQQTQHLVYPLAAGLPASFAYLNLRAAWEMDVELFLKAASKKDGSPLTARGGMLHVPEPETASPGYIGAFLGLVAEGLLAEKPAPSEFGYCRHCPLSVNCLRFRKDLLRDAAKAYGDLEQGSPP